MKVAEHTEDITACYDHVQFKVLQHGGVVAQFPLALLRLSISVLTWPRSITLGPFVTAPLYPTRGMVAGVTRATFELKATLTPIVNETHQNCEDYGLTIVVDDISGSSTTETVVDTVKAQHKGALQLRTCMMEAGFTLDLAKANVLSNCNETLVKVRKVFGGLAGEPTVSARRLGVDCTLGNPLARKRPQTQLKRFRKAMRRAAKLSTFVKRVKTQRAKAARKNCRRCASGSGLRRRNHCAH